MPIPRPPFGHPVYWPLPALLALVLMVGCQSNETVHEPANDGPVVVLEYDAPPDEALYSDLTRQETEETIQRLHAIRAALAAQGHYRGPIRHIWDRIRAGRQIHFEDNLRIEQQATYLLRDKSYITRVSKRAEPFIHYIVEELERRNMPTELAILPVIESAYRPNAISKSKAVGLWQFIGPTSRFLGMRHSHWYDARRDVIAATHYALDYLSMLNKKFNGDWLLALAAYNGGHGTISRAMERNKRRGKPTDFWSLKLVNETRDYVPRFLAASLIYTQPDPYDVTVYPVANRPYFEVVKINRQVNLNAAQDLSSTDRKVFKALNAGFTRGTTDPKKPKRLLVPIKHAKQLKTALANMKPERSYRSGQHIVRTGDSLGKIAQHYKSSVSELQRLNEMNDTIIRVGQRLIVPASNDRKPVTSTSVAKNKRTGMEFYVVQTGDTLWSIARLHKISLGYLLSLNDLKNDAVLKPGQRLRIRASDKPLALN